MAIAQSFDSMTSWENTTNTAQSFIKPQYTVMMNRGNSIVAVPRKPYGTQLSLSVCEFANSQIGLSHILASHRVPAVDVTDEPEYHQKWWRLFSGSDVVTGAKVAQVVLPYLLAVPSSWCHRLDDNADDVVSMLCDTATKVAERNNNGHSLLVPVSHQVSNYDKVVCNKALMKLVCLHSGNNLATWCAMVNVMMDYGVADFSQWRVIQMMFDDIEVFSTMPREWLEHMVEDDTMLTYNFYTEPKIAAMLSDDTACLVQYTPPLSTSMHLTLANADCKMGKVPQRSFDFL